MNRSAKIAISLILLGTAAYLIYKYTGIIDWFNKQIGNSTPANIPESSRLFLYYNERLINDNIYTDSGAHMRDIGKALATYGACSESLFPYDVSKFAEKPSDAAYADGLNNKIGSYYAVTDLNGIKQSIAIMQQPVLMGIDIYESFESDAVTGTGIVPIPAAGEKLMGGHAVLVVGYDDTKNWLKCRNSWGEFWGDDGYFYLPYDYLLGGVFDCWVLQK
jgi:C1A family cysteine protease